MKTKILFISIFLLNFSTLILAQKELKMAPINPDFEKYMQDKKLKVKEMQTKVGRFFWRNTLSCSSIF